MVHRTTSLVRTHATWLVAAMLSACAAEPRYEPLVCDPAADDRQALGYQWVNEWVEAPLYQRHGRALLVVDGSCRYFVYEAGLDPQAIRTGVLDGDILARLNDELATGPWEEIDGVKARGGGIDSPWMAVWRDGLGGSCEGVQRCESAPSGLARMVERSQRWIEVLHAVGTPTTGPLRLFASEGELAGTVRHTWTGETDLAALFGEVVPWEGVRIESAADAALLRALRAELGENQTLALEAGGRVWTVWAVDETPFHDEHGYLRPPFRAPHAGAR